MEHEDGNRPQRQSLHLHVRTDFSPDERRLMRRVTTLREKPM
jgi:hypothetical protein